MAVQELRVHGVSGTPPRNMLYTDPIEVVPDGDPGPRRYVRLFRTTDFDDFGVDEGVRAFHWGGLTSANRLTALWVLLLPFSLANLAGWSARVRTRSTVTWVRLFGLLLTGVFVDLALTTAVDVYWHWPSSSPSRLGWVALIFGGVGLGWWVLVSEASTRSHFDHLTFAQRQRLLWAPDEAALQPPGTAAEPVWDDPATADITDDAVWQPHSIVHRLRRIHFGFGFLMMAYAAAVASDTGWKIPGLFFDIPTGIAVASLLVSAWVLAAQSGRQGRLVRWLTVWHPIVGAVVAAAAVSVLATAGVEADIHWPHLHDTSAMLVVLGVVTVVGTWITAGRIAAGSSTLAVLFGLIMGSGATLALADYLGVAGFRVGGVNWVAAGVMAWVLTVGLVVGVTLVVNTRSGADRAMWYSIHRTTGGLRGLFAAMPAFAFVTVTYVLARRCRTGGGLFERCIQEGDLPDRIPAGFGTLVAWLFVAGALALIVFFLRTDAIAPAIVMAVAVVVLVVVRPSVTLFGVDLSFTDVEATALTFAVAVPSALIIRRLSVGIMPGGAESRRGTGVIWDVVMFWPRWFHPLAPPSYGPHAVTRLRHEIESTAGLTPRARRKPLVVAAHSQGTIISLVAMALVAGGRRVNPLRFDLAHPEKLARLGYMTYGAPIGHLYDTYFPSAGFIHLAAALAEGFGAYDGEARRRWVNLYRPTDPIGGPVLPVVDVEISDPEVPPGGGKPVWQLHSRYEPTATFRRERARIAGLIDPQTS